MKWIGLLLASFVLAMPQAHGPATPPRDAEKLESGERPVGFRVLTGSDTSRSFGKGEPRPVPIAIWYPAAEGRRGRTMSYRNYVELTASELSRAEPARETERQKTVRAFEAFLESAHVTSSDIRKVLATPMKAVADSPPAEGHFPLVLLSLGNGEAAHEQAFLAELLAGHGYVVAATPSATRISGPMKSEEEIAAKAEEQAGDLAYAALAVKNRKDLEKEGMAVVGYSFGARPALLLAMCNASVRALVSLDGGIGARTGKGILERSSLFDAKAMMAPILHFYEELDSFMAPDFGLLESLSRSRRFLVKTSDMRHVHFTSFAPLSAEARSLGAATSAAAGTGKSYEAVCRLTLSFLDAFVKQSSPRRDWRTSDPQLLPMKTLEPSGGGDWIEGPEGKLRVDDGGSGGIPVLFVHGNGGNRTQWTAQLRHLRASRRAVAFDLRGMGESERARNGDYSVEGFAEDIGGVADALKLERFVLVGHSYGGAVVAAYAGLHPDRLAGLVFADVAGDIRNPPPAQIEARRRGFEPANYEDFTRRWFEAILVHGTDATKTEVMRSLRATPRDVFIAASNSLNRFDPVSALASYKGPALHIASYLAMSSAAIHQSIPGLRVVPIRDASHWLMMDQPELFNRALDDFLGGLK